MMKPSDDNPLADYAGRLRRHCLPHYIAPEFHIVSAADSGERMGLPVMIDRLARTLPETWFLRGPAGSGKTSLINALAVALAERNVACLRVTPELLRHIQAPADIPAFVRSQAPTNVVERVWKARASRHRVVLLIDGVNEIRREWGDDARWAFIKSLIIGGHRFPVVAASRYSVDVDFDTLDSRTIHDASFVPLTDSAILCYLTERGLEANDALLRMRAAGLEGAGSNPFLLSLIADYLLAIGQEVDLPRSRAGLLSATLDHALSHLRTEDRTRHGVKVEMRAVAAASAILSLRHPDGFRLPALEGLLRPSAGNELVAEAVVSGFPHTHLVTRNEDRYRYVHESLVDFGIALALRDRPLPPFALQSDAVDHLLGDWVGLSADPDSAARDAAEKALLTHRPDALVDVLIANHGVLSPGTRRELWMAVGEGFDAGRVTRDRMADALGRLARSQTSDALRNRVLWRLEVSSPLVADKVADLMFDGSLNALTLQKLRRHELRRRFDESAESRSAQPPVVTEEDLKSGDPEIRFLSVNRLCDAPDFKLQPVLLDLLARDPDQRVRGASAKALGILGDPRAIDALAVYLLPEREPDCIVRGSAANAMGRIADPRALDVLAVCLDPAREPDGIVRGSAANSLGRIGDPGALAVLAISLDPAREPESNVRGSAANALGWIADPRAIDALALCLDPTREPRSNVRGSAANALGRIADPRALDALADCLDPVREPDGNVRGSAANALGRIADPRALDALALCLRPDREPESNVRGSAANALGRIGDVRALEALARCLDPVHEPEGDVRGSAAKALGRIADPRAIDAIALCLDPAREPDGIVRGSAAYALGRIADPRALDALVLCLDPAREPNSNVRGSAANALGRIADPRASDPLRARCLDASETVRARSSALDALGRVTNPGADWLIALAESVRKETRDQSQPGIGPLIGKIIEVASALAPTPATVVWLRGTARNSRDPLARTAAVQALDVIGELDDGTVRFLIDPASRRPDGRPHDTDNGVRGSVGAAIIRRFSGGQPPDGWLDLAAIMCVDPETWSSVIHATFSSLDRMDATSGLRALDAFAAALPQGETVNRYLTPIMERKRERLARRREGELTLSDLIDHPEEALMSFQDLTERGLDGGEARAPDVVLITAMYRERTAAISELRDRGLSPVLQPHGGRFYHRFALTRSAKPALEAWLAQPTGEGPHATQALLADVLILAPRMILMVGVAGGVQGRVKEGDVVMARQIHNYEPGKDTTAGFLPRPQTYKCSALLTDLANALHASGDLDDALGGSPLHTDKDCASGEKVLMAPTSEVRQRIEAQSVDVIAFETEGHGMLHPLWERERKQLPPIPAGLIKTVTDLGDPDMAAGKEARQREGTLRAMRVALALVPHL